MEQVRSFIAIELPDELRRELSQLVAQLAPAKQPWAKWVDPNGIHLTLKFLGDIPPNKIGEITRAMEEAAHGIPPFHLEVKGLGAFPNLKRAEVAWVGISGELDKLARLQQSIESNLARLGFAPEPRAFTPHLTLARLRRQASFAERQSFGQIISGASFASAHVIEVDAIGLIRSQLAREGAVYTRLSLVSLRKSSASPHF